MFDFHTDYTNDYIIDMFGILSTLSFFSLILSWFIPLYKDLSCFYIQMVNLILIFYLPMLKYDIKISWILLNPLFRRFEKKNKNDSSTLMAVSLDILSFFFFFFMVDLF